MNILNIFKKGKFFLYDITDIIYKTTDLKEGHDFIYLNNGKSVEMISSICMFLGLWDTLWEYKLYDTLEELLEVHIASLDPKNEIHFSICSKNNEIVEIDTFRFWDDGYKTLLTYENGDAIEYSWTFEYDDIPHVINRVIYENNII